jgi:hypothetical protein
LVLELPRTIYYETKEQGPLVGIPVGFLAGFGLGMRRTVVGAYSGRLQADLESSLPL